MNDWYHMKAKIAAYHENVHRFLKDVPHSHWGTTSAPETIYGVALQMGSKIAQFFICRRRSEVRTIMIKKTYKTVSKLRRPA